MTSAWRHRLFVYGITIPFAVVLAFPFFWMGVTSLKPEAQVYDPTKVWRFHATLANYGYLFHHTEYVRWLRKNGEEVYLVGGLVRDLVQGTFLENATIMICASQNGRKARGQNLRRIESRSCKAKPPAACRHPRCPTPT